jgi:hypothetical protein
VILYVGYFRNNFLRKFGCCEEGLFGGDEKLVLR